MSEEKKKPEEEKTVEAPAEKKEPAAAAPEEAKASLTRNDKGEPKDVSGEIYVTCSERVTGGLHDSSRNVRIPPAGDNPVRVAGVKKGSWLWCQMDAGLVIKVGS